MSPKHERAAKNAPEKDATLRRIGQEAQKLAAEIEEKKKQIDDLKKARREREAELRAEKKGEKRSEKQRQKDKKRGAKATEIKKKDWQGTLKAIGVGLSIATAALAGFAAGGGFDGADDGADDDDYNAGSNDIDPDVEPADDADVETADTVEGSVDVDNEPEENWDSKTNQEILESLFNDERHYGDDEIDDRIAALKNDDGTALDDEAIDGLNKLYGNMLQPDDPEAGAEEEVATMLTGVSTDLLENPVVMQVTGLAVEDSFADHGEEVPEELDTNNDGVHDANTTAIAQDILRSTGRDGAFNVTKDGEIVRNDGRSSENAFGRPIAGTLNEAGELEIDTEYYNQHPEEFIANWLHGQGVEGGFNGTFTQPDSMATYMLSVMDTDDLEMLGIPEDALESAPALAEFIKSADLDQYQVIRAAAVDHLMSGTLTVEIHDDHQHTTNLTRALYNEDGTIRGYQLVEGHDKGGVHPIARVEYADGKVYEAKIPCGGQGHGDIYTPYVDEPEPTPTPTPTPEETFAPVPVPIEEEEPTPTPTPTPEETFAPVPVPIEEEEPTPTPTPQPEDTPPPVETEAPTLPPEETPEPKDPEEFPTLPPVETEAPTLPPEETPEPKDPDAFLPLPPAETGEANGENDEGDEGDDEDNDAGEGEEEDNTPTLPPDQEAQDIADEGEIPTEDQPSVADFGEMDNGEISDYLRDLLGF